MFAVTVILLREAILYYFTIPSPASIVQKKMQRPASTSPRIRQNVLGIMSPEQTVHADGIRGNTKTPSLSRGKPVRLLRGS